METVNPQPLKGSSYDEDVHRRAALGDGDDDGGGGFDADDKALNGGFEEVARTNPRTAHRGNGSNLRMVQQASRTSELTIAFEGEVYVFPAVTPQKVQAVLLLLEGADTPTSSVPTSEFLLQKNSRSVDDMSRGPKLSRRIASLVRFREKRKDRCFEKKIRYTCRKEVAERMHRKNGQFASLKDPDNTDFGKWEPSNGTVHRESTPRTCQHCGTSENATPAMRRGPAGPRTLCNACGLMWANKGTLRDLTKGGRHNSSDQNGPGTPDVKPSTMERENHYANQGEEESPEETKPLPLDSEHSLRPNEEDLLETDEIITDPLPMHVENSSLDLDEEDFPETLDELGNVAGSEFEIPETLDDQVDVEDSDIGTEWPGT